MRRAFREFIVMLWPWGAYVLAVYATAVLTGIAVVVWFSKSMPKD
jgi:hypothetical protein